MNKNKRKISFEEIVGFAILVIVVCMVAMFLPMLLTPILNLFK